MSRITGAPTITIMGAVVDELNRRGVKKVAVLTPYSEEVNETIQSSLESSGFEVTHMNGMNVAGAFAIADITPEQIVEYAREEMRGVEADCLFVSCANLRSVEVLEGLQAAAGRPVVTSNQAVLDGISRVVQAQV